jgi:glycopeptide antibiotics resistance protein
LFWSYREIWAGSQGLFWEDVLNVILLLPMGVLLPVVFGDSLSNHNKMFTRVILLSFLTSLTREVLQLIFKCGLFEFDDLFHNTLGAAIGYWLSQRLKKFNKFVRSA